MGWFRSAYRIGANLPATDTSVPLPAEAHELAASVRDGLDWIDTCKDAIDTAEEVEELLATGPLKWLCGE